MIIVATGIGKTNTSIYTQLLIDNFQPEAVIGLGVGGSLRDELQPLDVVLGTHFSHHDVRVEQMKNTFPFKTMFKADNRLMTHFGKYISEEKQGKVVSGEIFVSNPDKKSKINKTHPQSSVVDMETGSIAQCCYINNIPFVSLIGITDYADYKAKETYYANEKQAANQTGEVLVKILEEEHLSF